MAAKITVAKVTKALALIFATDPAELELLSELGSIPELDFDELDDFFELELLSGVELLFEELELLSGSSSLMNDVNPQNSSSS